MLITNLTDREDKLKGLGAGADDYIFKPFDRAELLFKVKTQASLSVLRRQINEKEKLAGVMDMAFEGAVLTDSNFNITQINRTAVKMLGLKEPAGNLEEIIMEKYGYIMDRKTYKGKFSVGKPGTPSSPALFLTVEYHKVLKTNGGECTYVFVFKDVTDDLSRNRIKMDFLNLISVKLRTPLAVISGHSEMLGAFEKDAKLKEIISVIIRNSRAVNSLMKRILFFVEIENTSLTETKVMFDIKGTAERFALEYKKLCELVETGETAEVPYWQALAAEELLGNAIKFGDKEKTRVTVTFDREGLSVDDNGPGIPANEQARVFEPFYQVNRNIPGDKAGAGIGLSIVRSLAESANREVRLEAGIKGGLKAIIERKVIG
jgi:two-component system phosphate regulon sensor histidine kinase PhoR